MQPNQTPPYGWQRKRIADLFDVRASGDIDWSRWSSEQDATHPHPVYANGRADSGLHGYASYAVEKGDAVTLTARGTLGELGYAFFRSTSFTPIGRLLVLRSKGEVDARFFASYINGRVRFAQENTGVAQLTAPQVTRYQIDLPPLSEQHAIATALSDVDALIAGLEKLIAKKRDLKQAAMQQLLTCQTRLPGFSGDWHSKMLGDIAHIQKGQLITTETLVAGSIPVIAGGKKPAYFHNKPNRLSKTITVSASGASAGYVAFHRSPIFASDCSTISEAKSYCIEFLYFSLQLQQEAIYSAQTGGAQPHIQPKDLSPLPVLLPIALYEQQTIAKVLCDMEDELAALESRLAKTRDLKQGMMQELLTGRKRLV
jgi:type I restriction enzyme S subunit